MAAARRPAGFTSRTSCRTGFDARREFQALMVDVSGASPRSALMAGQAQLRCVPLGIYLDLPCGRRMWPYTLSVRNVSELERADKRRRPCRHH